LTRSEFLSKYTKPQNVVILAIQKIRLAKRRFDLKSQFHEDGGHRRVQHDCAGGNFVEIEVLETVRRRQAARFTAEALAAGVGRPNENADPIVRLIGSNWCSARFPTCRSSDRRIILQSTFGVASDPT